ncbi:MAG TPA: YicC/YloC family endoribonuclease, partial [Steroidobacteraceae bacterium]|nr:YicC/YloC family endoribonuclease [Steroidobacteraceae bacterium]
MTGFARRECQGPWGTLSCELRSVNHRYLELALRLPDELRCLEGDARTLLGTNLRRGKVEAGIYLRSTAAESAALELNRALVAELKQRAAEVAEMLGGTHGAIGAFDVLRWPGVVREADRDLAPVATEAMSLLAETVAELNESRAREGAR